MDWMRVLKCGTKLKIVRCQMTRYDLALTLLEDKERLDEKVFVRDYDGMPTDNLLIQRYRDVDGILLSVSGWQNPYPATPEERKNMYRYRNIEHIRNILEEGYRSLYNWSCTATGQLPLKNAFEKIVEGLEELDRAMASEC